MLFLQCFWSAAGDTTYQSEIDHFLGEVECFLDEPNVNNR